MPHPQDPIKAPRLRWSAEEIDRLVREAAMLMLAAERNGKSLTKNKALALAQYVLPKERQREIGPDYNPSWMASEGRIEAMIEELRAKPPTAAETALEAEQPAASAGPATLAPGQKAAPPSKLRDQAGLFGESSSTQLLAAGEADAVPPPVPAPALPLEDLEAASPAVPPVVPPREPGAARPQRSAHAGAGPAREPSPAAHDAAPPALVEALAGLGVDVLAGALRTVASRALAGLLVDVLRQPEVQAALREAIGTAPKKRPFEDRPQGDTDVRAAARPGAQREAREVREVRQPERRVAEPGAAAAPRPPAASPVQHEPADKPASPREAHGEAESEPVLFDPNAWQSTPLHALPQRTARGASEPPKPEVVVFGLLPKDQQRLKAEFGQNYKLRFGSGAKLEQALDTARRADRIYAMVRFIPKDLDRGLAESGVPYSRMNSLSELRHELAVNPPLPRGDLL